MLAGFTFCVPGVSDLGFAGNNDTGGSLCHAIVNYNDCATYLLTSMIHIFTFPQMCNVLLCRQSSCYPGVSFSIFALCLPTVEC